jgi:LemA protein
MKGKGCIVLIVIVALIAIVGFWAVGVRNGFVGQEQNVNAKWSNVKRFIRKELT